MTHSIQIILVPTIMILVGILLKYFNILKSEDSDKLNKIVLNIALPALIFTNLIDATITNDMLILPVVAVSSVIIAAVIAYAYSKARSYSKSTTWTIILASSMMNTAFIGYPVIMGILGKQGFIQSIFYDSAIAILFVVFGIILVSIFGGNRKEVLYNALTFMPLWALILALIFNYFDIGVGYVIGNCLDYLSDATIPLIMISLGLKINIGNIRDKLQDSIFILLLRMIFIPVIVMISLRYLNLSELTYQVAVLDSAMPIAMNTLVLAITYDLDSELLASVIFASTILCLITLPIIVIFI